MAGQSIVGDLRLGIFSGGNFAGYIDTPINASTLTVTPGESTPVNRQSNNRTTAGQALGSFQNVTAPPTGAVTFDELVRRALEVALLSDSEDIAISAGTAVTETVTVFELDVWVPMTNANIVAAGFTATAPGSTSLTIDTDFKLDLRNGLIKFLSTSANVAKNDDVDLSYDHSGVTGVKHNSFTQQQVKARLLMDGTNRENNHRIRALIFEINLRPSNGFSLIGPADGFNTVDAEGPIITPSGFTTPMIWEDHGPEA